MITTNLDHFFLEEVKLPFVFLCKWRKEGPLEVCLVVEKPMEKHVPPYGGIESCDIEAFFNLFGVLPKNTGKPVKNSVKKKRDPFIKNQYRDCVANLVPRVLVGPPYV